MTGLRFLFRVTLRRLDLAAEIYHIKEPQKIPLVMSPDEAKCLLAMARSLNVRVLLALGYGCARARSSGSGPARLRFMNRRQVGLVGGKAGLVETSTS